MLTIFTTPKRFDGHIGIIQRNAIASWTRLCPQPEIILFGDETGTAEISREFGLRHVPNLAQTEFGAPLLPDLFEKAEHAASGDVLCYVNADIILLGDFLEALQKLSAARRKYLMVGRRWDVSIHELWDFEKRGGTSGLREYVSQHGKQGPPPGNSDFFVFPRGMWGAIPPLALGRAAWDAWLICEARRLDADVVDASAAVMAIHQTHDQSSYRQGLRQWRREINRNWEIAGDEPGRFCLWDATHTLTPEGLFPARGKRYLIRRISTFHMIHPRTGPLLKLFQRAASVARSMREKRRQARNPLLRLCRLVQSKLPADGITAVLGLSGVSAEGHNGHSLGLQLADSLTWGGLPVVIYDPESAAMERARRALGGPVRFANSAEECVTDADVIVLAAPRQEFRNLSTQRLVREGPRRFVIDCCEIWKNRKAQENFGYMTWSEK